MGLVQVAFRHLPKQRKLNEAEREETQKMLGLRPNKKLLQHHVVKTTGKPIALKDLHNLAANPKREKGSNLKLLLTEMKSTQSKKQILTLTIADDEKLKAE